VNARVRSFIEASCWIAGSVLCGAFLLARADSELGKKQGLDEFAAQLHAPDQALWSSARVTDYQAAVQLPVDAPVAILSVPALALQVPVYPHSNDLSLNRGTALIDGMAATPDSGGNLGIAGHRDGFFRALKDIRLGDVIEVRTRLKLHLYRVASIRIVDVGDVQLLADTEDPSVTLVTCYPFYYVGRAPQRFVVSATYEWGPPGST
jgi:sortase A